MRAPNHVDGNRRLQPRAYFDPAHGFGSDRQAHLIVPPGGDEVSARVAAVAHRLLMDWHAVGRKPSGAELGRRFGFSKQVFSEVVHGRRWPGEAVIAALWMATRTNGR